MLGGTQITGGKGADGFSLGEVSASHMWTSLKKVACCLFSCGPDHISGKKQLTREVCFPSRFKRWGPLWCEAQQVGGGSDNVSTGRSSVLAFLSLWQNTLMKRKAWQHQEKQAGTGSWLVTLSYKPWNQKESRTCGREAAIPDFPRFFQKGSPSPCSNANWVLSVQIYGPTGDITGWERWSQQWTVFSFKRCLGTLPHWTALRSLKTHLPSSVKPSWEHSSRREVC